MWHLARGGVGVWPLLLCDDLMHPSDLRLCRWLTGDGKIGGLIVGKPQVDDCLGSGIRRATHIARRTDCVAVAVSRPSTTT